MRNVELVFETRIFIMQVCVSARDIVPTVIEKDKATTRIVSNEKIFGADVLERSNERTSHILHGKVASIKLTEI